MPQPSPDKRGDQRRGNRPECGAYEYGCLARPSSRKDDSIKDSPRKLLLRKIAKQCIEFNGGFFVALDEDVGDRLKETAIDIDDVDSPLVGTLGVFLRF